jgi:DNA-binding response OmpR family regulator
MTVPSSTDRASVPASRGWVCRPRWAMTSSSAAEIAATPKAMLLLDYLLTHPDELLSRDRLLEVLWGFDFPVGTRAVDNRIAELRRALGDDATCPAWIETVAGQGYRFVARVDDAR